MTSVIAKKNRNLGLVFLLKLGLIGLLISNVIAIWWDLNTGLSFLIGIAIDVIPTVVFTLYAFRFSGAQNLRLVAGSLYRGESVKILLTAVLILTVIKFLPANMLALFIGFLVSKLMQLTKPLFL